MNEQDRAGGLAVAPLGVASVLIVDDSAVHRMHIALLCRALGIDPVHEASGGAAALLLLEQLSPPPSVMVVDIQMPGMDCIELLEQLLIRDVMPDLVIASGRESAMIDSVVSVAAGMGFHVLAGLEKPLTLAGLSDALDMRGVRGPGARPAGGAAADERDGGAHIPPSMLEAALRDGQIRVHYQPKADMRTGLIRGVEGLARWSHPELGDIAPRRFVPLAERYGLIHPLTFTVMEHALAQVSRWSRRGLRLSLAVNLSPLLLDWPGLANAILEVVERFQVPPGQLVFEITESSLVDADSGARGLLARLRLRGFGLSIDDYGTGFSSMQQLTRVPFTELKIDRSFVHGANGRKQLRTILGAAIDMASEMGMTTTAEGIETLEDWRLVQRLGCALGQGYFIARAMPGEHIPSWLKTHRARLPLLRAPTEVSSED
ncbi:Two-component response regulator [Bordetella sputigena]|uniref:EAL domain-containing response regulator n=1 Tax=Bordetella sputigena TaxID=1416810 RepID=UPI0039F06574